MITLFLVLLFSANILSFKSTNKFPKLLSRINSRNGHGNSKIPVLHANIKNVNKVNSDAFPLQQRLKKQRIDEIMVDRSLAMDVIEAQALIMAGTDIGV